MKIIKKATSYNSSAMELEAEGGDLLPYLIKISHNSKVVEYNTIPAQQACPVCDNSMQPLPPSPQTDWPTTTVTGSLDFGSTNSSDAGVLVNMPISEITYKCCNPKCHITKVRVKWE